MRLDLARRRRLRDRMAKGRNGGATLVIKKVEEGGHGHHGGAWKVAYADFVTAMMAFFLLMWLLNATTEEQRRGIADYFAPTNFLAQGQSGSGQPFGGATPNSSAQMMQDAGAIRLETGPMPVLQDVEREDDSETPARPVPWREGPEGDGEADQARRLAAQQGAAQPDATQLSDAALRAELARRDAEALERAAEELRHAIAQDPALADLARQFLVEQTPQGLRIQLLDSERQPMFALGGAAPNERGRALIARVAQVAMRVSNAVSITGHTDATPFRGGTDRSNWDLSTERANATRRLLAEAGLPETRIQSVAGHAEREPLRPEAPNDPANRRVAITLLRALP